MSNTRVEGKEPDNQRRPRDPDSSLHGQMVKTLRAGILAAVVATGASAPGTPAQGADEAKPPPAKNAPAKAENLVKVPGFKAATPVPRQIHAPVLAMTEPTGEGEVVVDYARHRYSLVVVLGTWNKRSAEISRKLNAHAAEFETRHIGVIGVFSHDTRGSLQKWKSENPVRFRVGIAGMDFIDALRNPKVPTFWLINNRGEILHRVELPSDEEIADVFKKAFLWTNF